MRTAEFDEFLRLNGRWAFALIRRHLADAAAAEDVYQEACWSAYRAFGEVRSDGRPEAWFRRIVLNAVIDHVRRKARRRDATPLPDDVVATTVDGGGLEDLLRDLETWERLAALLYYQERFAVIEIARRLDVPEGTVKTWLRRARERLRRHIGETLSKTSTKENGR